MLCNNCGEEIPDNAKFCLECGAKTVPVVIPTNEINKSNNLNSLKDNQTETHEFNKETPLKKKGFNKALIIGAITFLIVAITGIAFVLLTSGDKKNTVVDAGIKIPDVVNVDLATAKTLLVGKGLIPKVEYEYHMITEFGNVTHTVPEIGSMVETDSVVTIYISKGPSFIFAKDSTIEWYHISSYDGEDDWHFETPYIDNGILYIKCTTVKFAVAMKWADDDNNGYGFGNASINDTFSKTVPVTVRYSKKSFVRKEAQDLTLEIPLADLDTQKPTDMYLKLAANVNGKFTNISVNFSMSW